MEIFLISYVLIGVLLVTTVLITISYRDYRLGTSDFDSFAVPRFVFFTIVIWPVFVFFFVRSVIRDWKANKH